MLVNFSVYDNADYEIKLKAPIAFVIQTAVSVLLAGLAISTFLSGDIITGFGVIAAMGVFIGTIIMLYRGRYDLSVRIFTATIATLGLLYQYFSGYNNVLAFSHFVLMHIVVMVIANFLIRQKKIFNLYIFLTLTTFSGFIVFHIVNGNAGSADIDVLSQIDIVLVVYVVVLLILYHMKKTFIMVQEDATRQIEENKKRNMQMDIIITTAMDQLNGTLGLQGHTKETQESAEEINVKVENIRNLLNDMSRSFDSTGSAIAEIHNNMNDLSEKAQNQSANVVESSAAIEQMVASITSVANIIEQRKEGVQTLSLTSEKGEEIVNKTQDSFNHVLQQISSITDMTKIISGIASQTNLLAMNAAIEAAHAGDSGKGFAVVADEIRKLAENSAHNASQITTNLKELISSIEQTGIEVKNTGDSFNKIRTEVRDVSAAMEEIYSSTQELTKGSGEILSATSNLNNLTASVKEGVGVVESDLDIINTNIDNGKQLNAELNQVSDVIVNETSDILNAVGQIVAMAVTLNEKSEELNSRINSLSDPES